MLIPVIQKKEIASLLAKLFEYLNPSSFTQRREISFRKGHSKKTISASEKHEIWWYLGQYRKSNFTYWNCFGIYVGKEKRKALLETIEINMAKEDIYLRMAGLWATDGKNYFLLHSGNMGGGSNGIGRTSFLKKYKKVINIKKVMMEDGLREYFVVLKLQPGCIKQLAIFIKDVRKIKDEIKASNN